MCKASAKSVHYEPDVEKEQCNPNASVDNRILCRWIRPHYSNIDIENTKECRKCCKDEVVASPFLKLFMCHLFSNLFTLKNVFNILPTKHYNYYSININLCKQSATKLENNPKIWYNIIYNL